MGILVFVPKCLGTSPMEKRLPLGPHRRPMPSVLGGGRFLMGEVPLQFSSKKAAIASDQLYEGAEFRDHHQVGAPLALLDPRLDGPDLVQRFLHKGGCVNDRWSWRPSQQGRSTR